MLARVILAPAERALRRVISDLAPVQPACSRARGLEQCVRVDPNQPCANAWKMIARLEPVVDRLSERLGAHTHRVAKVSDALRRRGVCE